MTLLCLHLLLINIFIFGFSFIILSQIEPNLTYMFLVVLTKYVLLVQLRYSQDCQEQLMFSEDHKLQKNCLPVKMFCISVVWWYSDGSLLSSFLWQFKIQDGHNNPTYLECILKYLFLLNHLAKWSEIWHKSSNDGTL
jgi:hypothetical protein